MDKTPYESDIVTEAYNDLMMELFGIVPKHPEEYEIDRGVYTEHMQAIQEKYDLVQGHPQYLEFILTLVGRSPRFIKGAEDNDRTTTED